MGQSQGGQRAGEPRDEKSGDAGEEKRALDEADARQRVAKGRRHEHDGVLVQAERDLAAAPVAVHLPSRDFASGRRKDVQLERRVDDRVVEHVGRRNLVRIADGHVRAVAQRLDHDDAGADAFLDVACPRVVVVGTGSPQLARDGLRVDRELVQAIVDEPVFETRHDRGVHDPERPGDDGQDDEPELDGEPRMPELVHATSRNR
jgi:hypothetical protein